MPNTPHHPDRSIIIVGGGGHASVVADAALLMGFQIAGIVDDNGDAPLAVRLRTPCLGNLAELSRIGERGWIIGLGDLALRGAILKRAAASGLRPATTILHPSAVVSSFASIGRGVFIGPGVIVNPFAQIADHAILNSGCIIEHDCVIGENTHIAPGAALGGGVSVGRDTLVGLGARVLPGIDIGPHCTVGAGAVVISDVPEHTTVAGVPAGKIETARHAPL